MTMSGLPRTQQRPPRPSTKHVPNLSVRTAIASLAATDSSSDSTDSGVTGPAVLAAPTKWPDRQTAVPASVAPAS